MRRARTAEVHGYYFDRWSGRARFKFAIDSWPHTVCARYYEPPNLSDEVWAACLEELAAACLVDVAAASMARHAVGKDVRSGVLGAAVYRQASEALRLELVADNGDSLRHVPVPWKTGAGRSVAIKTPRRRRRVLLLMGGGKDSLYTYWLLRRGGYDVRCFYLIEARRTWQRLRRVRSALAGQIGQDAAFLNVNQTARLERRFRANYRSQFQIGQVVAASLPYALAHGCRYIALGIERSADLPMLWYRGRAVNHQDQKSRSFVERVNRYLAWRFRGAVEIISPIYGLYDL
jgi:hypothetical protein